MPVLLRTRGYRFEIYASDMNEPRHVHVRKSRKRAKVWLDPEVSLDYSRGYRPHEVNEILKLVSKHAQRFREDWDEFFGR